MVGMKQLQKQTLKDSYDLSNYLCNTLTASSNAYVAERGEIERGAFCQKLQQRVHSALLDYQLPVPSRRPMMPPRPTGPLRLNPYLFASSHVKNRPTNDMFCCEPHHIQGHIILLQLQQSLKEAPAS
ncbi:hypothetical protein VNO80_20411 [Phaseolus coccineus]|uniref:Uncharacterized protein n=1 Tax=Phaseolus coccineus TaxID=3886 RepID=A0AAN9MMU3_PHACN